MEIDVKVSIDLPAIRSLLCSAFEGGSNYWYEITRWELAERYHFDDFSSFAEILDDNADANTGDVFLQCCLFGDVIYG